MKQGNRHHLSMSSVRLQLCTHAAFRLLFHITQSLCCFSLYFAHFLLRCVSALPHKQYEHMTVAAFVLVSHNEINDARTDAEKNGSQRRAFHTESQSSRNRFVVVVGGGRWCSVFIIVPPFAQHTHIHTINIAVRSSIYYSPTCVFYI